MKLVAVIILFSLNFQLQAKPEQIVTPTNAEKSIAKNFYKLFDLAEDGHINYRLAKNLHKKIKNSITFSNYLSWTKDLIEINKVNSIEEAVTKCGELSANVNKAKTPVRKFLKQNTTKICFNKFLKFLSQTKKLSNYETFFAENIIFYLNKTNSDELKFFLSRLNKKSETYRSYSKVLTNFYVQNKRAPSKEFLPYMYISTKFTQFIQESSFENRRTARVLGRELNRLRKNILSSLDRGDYKSEYLKSFLLFSKTNKSLIPEKDNLKNTLSLGKSFSRRSKTDEANKCFKSVIANGSFYKDEATFEYLWSYISDNKYSEAINKVVNVYKDQMKDNSKFLFWSGISYLRNKNKDIASAYFNKVQALNPLSYYSVLASKINHTELLQNKINRSYASIPKASQALNQLNHRWLRRIRLWGNLDATKFLKLELQEIEGSANKKNLKLNLLAASEQLSISGSYLESFKIIYKSMRKYKLELSQNSLEVLFPKPYMKELLKVKTDFDPIIALSLMRQESGFNKSAQSIVGARGLMQIMPNTGKRFKKNLKASQLYHPKTNLKIGTKYISKLLKRYDNNLVYTLAAYNAGENRVDKWKGKYLKSKSILHDIENIPYNETRKYVKLIFRNIFFYKLLKNQKEDTSEVTKIYDIDLGFN